MARKREKKINVLYTPARVYRDHPARVGREKKIESRCMKPIEGVFSFFFSFLCRPFDACPKQYRHAHNLTYRIPGRVSVISECRWFLSTLIPSSWYLHSSPFIFFILSFQVRANLSFWWRLSVFFCRSAELLRTRNPSSVPFFSS